MSKVAAYYHIVFCTKRREMTIPLQYREDVYRFIWKIISDAGCTLIRVGGIQNHVHILLSLRPDVALSQLVQTIKSHTSGWMSRVGIYKHFDGWAAGYFACSVSPEARSSVIDYIKNQEAHHLGTTFDEEVKHLYSDAGIEYDDRDLR